MRKVFHPLGLLHSNTTLTAMEDAHEFNLLERFKALLRTDLSTANPRGGVFADLEVTINGDDTKIDIAAGKAFDVDAEMVTVPSTPATPPEGPARPAREAVTPGASGTTRTLYLKYAVIENDPGDTFRSGFSGDTRQWDSYELVWVGADGAPGEANDPGTDHIPLATLTFSGASVTVVTDQRIVLVLGHQRYEAFQVDMPPTGWFMRYGYHTGPLSSYNEWGRRSFILATGLGFLESYGDSTTGDAKTMPQFVNLLGSQGEGELPAMTGPTWFWGPNGTWDEKHDYFLIPWTVPDDIYEPSGGADPYYLRFEVFVGYLAGNTTNIGRFKLGAKVDTGTPDLSSEFTVVEGASPAWKSYDIDLTTIGASPGDVIQLIVDGSGHANGIGNAAFIHGRITGHRALRNAVQIGSLT